MAIYGSICILAAAKEVWDMPLPRGIQDPLYPVGKASALNEAKKVPRVKPEAVSRLHSSNGLPQGM